MNDIFEFSLVNTASFTSCNGLHLTASHQFYLYSVNKRLKIIISAVAITAATAIGIILFWPDKESTAEKAPFVKAAFLSQESPWADSLAQAMTEEEIINALLIVEGSKAMLLYGFGGMHVADLHLSDTLLVDSLRMHEKSPLMLSISEPEFLFGSEVQWNQLLAAPDTFQRITSDLMHKVSPRFKYSLKFLSPQNRIFAGKPADTKGRYLEDSLVFNGMSVSGILLREKGDTMFTEATFREQCKTFSENQALAMLFEPFTLLETHSKKATTLRDYLENQELFSGMLVADLRSYASKKHLQMAFDNGADFLFVNEESLAQIQKNIQVLIREKELDMNDLRTRVHRTLLVKSWLGLTNPADTSAIALRHPEFLPWCRENILEQSVTVLTQNGLPFPLRERADIRLIDFHKTCPRAFNDAVQFFYPIKAATKDFGSTGDLTVVWLHGDSAITDKEKEQLKTFLKSPKTVLVQVGEKLPDDIHPANHLVMWNNSITEASATAQIIFGGMNSNGKMPVETPFAEVGQGIRSKQHRIGFANPIAVGLSIDTLRKLDYIAQQGISGGAYPGCQVLMVKNGRVVWNKNYGTLDYTSGKRVDGQTIYDLASVTKISASALVLMKLYEVGKIGLDDPLEKYLPDTLSKHLYNRRSTLADITWREILTHRSGLPAGINVYKYMKYTDEKNEIGRYDKYYCDLRDDSMYCVEVAKNFYLEYVQLDSMWRAINLTPPGAKEYHYSDINANLFYLLGLRVLKQMYPPQPPPRGKKIQPRERWDGTLWEQKLAEWFYKPLQLERTMYLPLRNHRPDNIAPTAIDREWRKQELRGHVHDPTAAVFGGIAGSAGLFSTAWEQAILWQMTLFGGNYGGQQFLKPETIEEFTKRQAQGHRGLAFNKPVGEGLYGIPAQCSPRTYGHTGYTGNSVWVDPDNEIIYILLSNRSHPKGDNPSIINLGIQGRLHQVMYDAVIF